MRSPGAMHFLFDMLKLNWEATIHTSHRFLLLAHIPTLFIKRLFIQFYSNLPPLVRYSLYILF